MIDRVTSPALEPFRWDACFLTGQPVIDAQHERLVELINRYGVAVMQPAGASAQDAESLFGELATYALKHFAEEERHMALSGVDARHVERHRADHRTFVDEVRRMRLGSRRRAEDTGPLLAFLVHWLTYHILGMDRSLVRQMDAIAAGAAPHAAYVAEATGRDPATEMLLRSLHGLFMQMSERNRALSSLNLTLEQRVEERTRALSEANRQLETLALTDTLTGLPNRLAALRHLAARWAESVHRGTPLACIAVDADGFKSINDRHGHDAGDEVLRSLARRLTEAVRRDDFVCRLGGDEFLVICGGTGIDGALQVAEKMRRHVAALRVPAGRDGVWQGSVSVGVAASDGTMTHSQQLLKRADEALYAAKAQGRNRVATDFAAFD